MRDFHWKLNLSWDPDKQPQFHGAGLAGGAIPGLRGLEVTPRWPWAVSPSLSPSPSRSLTLWQCQHPQEPPGGGGGSTQSPGGAAGWIQHCLWGQRGHPGTSWDIPTPRDIPGHPGSAKGSSGPAPPPLIPSCPSRSFSLPFPTFPHCCSLMNSESSSDGF